MCGIAGVLQLDGHLPDLSAIRRMSDSVAHRGPDGQGHVVDGPCALGHRRLAIIDLSDAAHQPMTNEDGSVLMVYNGEVYNFRELRTALESAGHVFRSATDSEVVVHGYEEWGDSIIERLNGMFALALWDRRRQRLVLARDRHGIKPLYWMKTPSAFLFGSEIKAILQHPSATARLSYAALNEYLSFQNLFTDLTLFDGIRLLPAASILSLSLPSREPERSVYWDYPFHLEPHRMTEGEAAEAVREAFVNSVHRQLVSDVPVGAYLSGGMDSGSITAVAGQRLPRLRTFTAGFDLSSASGLELGYDERRSAESMANLLKTEHYEVVLHAGDMEQVLPELVWHLEDLRVGQSYPNYYVARLASKFVKVVMSGTGGDELFGGYPWRYLRGIHSADREDYLRRYYRFWQRLVPDEEKASLFNDDTRRQVGELSCFEQFRSVFDRYPRGIDTREDYVDASLYFELKTFLHGLLVMEDKLSMAHSLETRVPFLDDDMVELAVRLPAHHKLQHIDSAPVIDENAFGKRVRYELETSEGKAVLRRAMAKIIPPEITERHKQGFSAPDGSWFRGESIDYINRFLRHPQAAIYDYLRHDYVVRILDEHTSGAVNHRLLIWSLLNLEWWIKIFLDGDPAGTDRRTSVGQPSADVSRYPSAIDTARH